MKEIIILINKIGFWNLFSILTFVIGTIYTAYTYFKSFYRIVYSSQRICKNCECLNDWQKESQNFTTRIIFYNNGRKALTKKEIKKIQIFSSEINSFRIIESESEIKFKMKNKKILNIEFDFIDASKFFVLEFNHNNSIDVKGRVAETGDFLHTETKGWLIANFILVIYCFASIFFVLFNNQDEFMLLRKMGVNLIMIILFSQLFRYIHKLFFIADSITSNFLKTKDKWNNEFYNEF